MKKYLFLSIVLCLSKFSISQFSKAAYLITYDRQFNYGWSTNANNVIHSTCYLYYNDTAAFYFQLPDKDRKDKFDNTSDINNVTIADTVNQLFIDLSKQIGYSIVRSKVHNGIYGDSVYTMKWIITDEIKKIDSINCQKATCQFRGRTYTAWYAQDIVLPYGPSKFGGLPGLIVELYDSDKFDYYALRKISNSQCQYHCFNNQWYINYKTWVKEELAVRKKIIEAMQANNNSGNCSDCSGTSEIISTIGKSLRNNEAAIIKYNLFSILS